MLQIKDELKLQEVNGEYSTNLTVLLNEKEIKGNQNITAHVKSDTCEVLTSEVKLKKNVEIKFKNPAEKTEIYLTVEGQEPLTLEFNIKKDNHLNPETNLEKTEEKDQEQKQIIPVDTQQKYPVLTNIQNVVFEFIFTPYIKEILANNIKSVHAKEIYQKALSTSKIMFFRDTNTNTLYWITKDKIISNSNPTALLIDVNEYLQSLASK